MINSNIPIPTNLPLLINDPRPLAVSAVTDILHNSDSMELRDILASLGTFWPVKVWFSQPVTISVIPRWINNPKDGYRTHKSTQTSDVHIFRGFFKHGIDDLCYKYKQRGRTGQYFTFFDKVIKYEPVIERTKKTEFTSFEEFKAKFDPYFITEEQIKELWNEGSCQHGGKYIPSDFRHIGPVGKKVMERYLHFFKGVGTGGDEPGYTKYGGQYILTQRHTTNHHPGRDITIQHTSDRGYVHYNSEFAGCGNGRYGLVATRNTFLHLEDD
jgi:hypothetical protein